MRIEIECDPGDVRIYWVVNGDLPDGNAEAAHPTLSAAEADWKRRNRATIDEVIEIRKRTHSTATRGRGGA